MASSVTFHDDELRRLLESESGPVAQDLIRRGQRVLNRARANCPVDTGRLRASLTMELMHDHRGLFVRVGSNLDYLMFVHEGTGIYGPTGAPIRPRNARFLRWPATNNSGSGNRRYVGGATARYVYARQVRGVKGRPFLAEALAAAAG